MAARTVLFVSRTAKLGGAELSLLHLADSLDPDRYSPLVLLPEEEEGNFRLALRQQEIPCCDLPFSRLPRLSDYTGIGSARLNLQRGAGSIAHVAAETAASIVHANTAEAACFVNSGDIRRRGAKFVWHMRGLRLPLRRKFSLLWKADAAVCVSAAAFSGARPWAGRKRTHLLPGGVHLEPFANLPAQVEAREKLGLPLDAPLVLCASRYERAKRHDLFCDALALIRAKMPQVVGVMAGGREQAEYGKLLRKKAIDRAAKAGVELHVIDLEPEEMPWLYASADLLLHMAEREPFSRVLAEAMACGLPLVAAGSGGAASIIGESGQGTLVRPGDALAAAKAALAYLQEPALRAACRSQGWQNATPFSAPACANALMDLYDRLLDTGKKK